MRSAVVIAAFALSAQPNAPYCGTESRDIGRGFAFTQYMFDGSPEFRLNYQPATSKTRTNGVSLTGPFGLTFIQMNFSAGQGETSGLTDPHVGFYYYPFAKADGMPLTGTVTLDCGNGTILHERYQLNSPGKFNGPIRFWEPWLNQPEQRCLRELQRNGRFALTIAEPEGSLPSVAIVDRVPLGWAIRKVKAIWTQQMRDARQGRCRLMPPPPPPF